MSEPAREACPGCGTPQAISIGSPFVGAVGFLWWKRPFEERLFRCAEGHVYSVRLTGSGEAETTTVELHESVEAWLQIRTGAQAPTRPPGL